MALDDRTTQEQLTPEERRTLLRAFADRMLLKVTAMDDPEDLPGVEKAVRVAAVIERLYSRCDRAERQKSDKSHDSRKAEAERATHEVAAIKARVSLANTLKWGEERRRDLGPWWDAAQEATTQAPAPVKTPGFPQKAAISDRQSAEISPNKSPSSSQVSYVDLTDGIEAARTELALQKRAATNAAQGSVPPFRGPP